MKRRLILASASPRRKDILSAAGYEFEILVSDADEEGAIGSPSDIVMELAKRKAKASKILCNDSNAIVVGADTLVFYRDRQLGKPKDVEQWKEYIELISGDEHSVITGVCICYDNKYHTFYSETKVYVDKMSESEIEEYISHGDDIDKAGGYAIQGFFSKYIPSINGEYNNVVGFPIAMFNKELKRLDLDV